MTRVTVGFQVEFHWTGHDLMKSILGNLINKDLRIFNVEPNVWCVPLTYVIGRSGDMNGPMPQEREIGRGSLLIVM